MPQIADFATKLTSSFSTELAGAICTADLPGLQDGPSNDTLAAILDSGDLKCHLNDQVKCIDELESGLWLLAGDLDRSHTLSQDLPSAEGSFLHGIMHRREGDFGNAKYWFRRVGTHDALATLFAQDHPLYQDAFDFVDACNTAIGSGDPDQILPCVQAQWIEWQCLMEHLCG